MPHTLRATDTYHVPCTMYLAKEKNKLYSVVSDVAKMCRIIDFFCPSRYLEIQWTHRVRQSSESEDDVAFTESVVLGTS